MIRGDERGVTMLAALDEAATLRNVPVSAVSLAWLLARQDVIAPIAGARNSAQLTTILPAADTTLTDAELQRRDATSA
ncbi:aldo/keto reductase family protein [Halopolyspora algeriensis]|uniref:Aldo/keto reductase family protein n=1 Tax=Halopolyspora algeriensis TaxID=1500506 RepID=A0A368VQ45_9ACTN|nr:aldo/keto reductase [Halopolyspora algeriensis]RCW43624.1 aldo/keto reductase family protein [Halopolyspora algeriensis]